MKQVAARVVSNREAMPGVYHIWLEAKEMASEAKPGQFVMVNCGGNALLPRPLSIHQADGNKISLLCRMAGDGTRWLSQSKTGDIINLFGPAGNGFSISPKSKNLLLIAGGIGIAPLYFLAERALADKKNVTFLYGTADRNRHPVLSGIETVAATDDGSVGYHGLVTDLIPEYAAKADQVFACGPLPMYRGMSVMPALLNKPVQVSLEVRMGCGRGVCYGCTVKTKHGLKKVCEDGPVFELSDIMWEELNFSQAI